MKVRERSARRLFRSLGLRSKGDIVFLESRLNNLADLIPSAKPGFEPEGKDRLLMEAVLETLEKGETVDVIEDVKEEMAEETQAVESNGEQVEAPPKAKAKKKAPKAKDKAPKKEAAPKGPKKLSCVDAAAKVLAGTKKPLSAADIYAKMTEKGLWDSAGGKTPVATVAARIYTEIQNKGPESRFVRAGRGLFAAKK